MAAAMAALGCPGRAPGSSRRKVGSALLLCSPRYRRRRCVSLGSYGVRRARQWCARSTSDLRPRLLRRLHHGSRRVPDRGILRSRRDSRSLKTCNGNDPLQSASARATTKALYCAGYTCCAPRLGKHRVPGGPNVPGTAIRIARGKPRLTVQRIWSDAQSQCRRQIPELPCLRTTHGPREPPPRRLFACASRFGYESAVVDGREQIHSTRPTKRMTCSLRRILFSGGCGCSSYERQIGTMRTSFWDCG